MDGSFIGLALSHSSSHISLRILDLPLVFSGKDVYLGITFQKNKFECVC